MFKLVVLSAVLLIVSAAPSPSVLAPAVAVAPLATSHTSRVDIHSNPIIQTTHYVSAPLAVPLSAYAAVPAVPAIASYRTVAFPHIVAPIQAASIHPW